MSDNLDGILARQEDKRPGLAKFGFKRSELGRKLDPSVDVLFTSSMLVAGLKSRVIPKSIGFLSLAQKATKSTITLAAERKGIELQVTKAGKYSEFATNLGIGFMFAAENINNLVLKNIARIGAGTLALAGIGAAAFVTLDYSEKAGLLTHGTQSETLHYRNPEPSTSFPHPLHRPARREL